MERFKDFLYDISDLLLAFLIIALMTTLLSWKLAGSLIGDAGNDLPPAPAASFEPLTDPPDPQERTSETVPPNPEPETAEPEPEPAAAPSPEAPAQEAAAIHVRIPSGTTGIQIAGILRDAGLVESTSDFIDRIEARGLSARLQSGTFEIESDKTLDQIIDILTGQ